MQLELTPEFTNKVFQKVGALSREDFDLSTEQSQLAFCTGFIDYLQKESSMDPYMAVGLIRYLAEQGASSMEDKDMSKQASDKIAGWFDDAMTGLGKATGYGIQHLTPSSFSQGAAQGYAGGQVNDWKNQFMGTGVGKWLQSSGIADQAGKAWDWVKKPENLKGIVAPLAMGIGGALLPKLWGGGPLQSLAGAAGGALLGRYTIGGATPSGDMSQIQDMLRLSNAKAVEHAK